MGILIIDGTLIGYNYVLCNQIIIKEKMFVGDILYVGQGCKTKMLEDLNFVI